MTNGVLLSPEVIGSYPNLYKAVLRKDAKPEDKPKFSITTLFTHDAIKTPEYQAIVAAVMECGIAKWGKPKLEEMIREGVFESPFHKDIGSKGYDTAVFAVRVSSSANEQYPPLVLDARKRGADGKPLSITDSREIYAGVKLRVSYATRAYGGPGTKWTAGIALDLRNVLKVGDGERLAAAGPDGSEFGGIVPPPESGTMDSASMASLLG
jgi:hypothetical protein